MPKAAKRNFSNGDQAKAQFLIKIKLVWEPAPVSPSSLTRQRVWDQLVLVMMIDILAVAFNSKVNSFADPHFKVYLTIKDKKKVSADDVLSWFSPLKSTCTGITNIVLLPIKQASERVLKSLTSLDAAAMHRRSGDYTEPKLKHVRSIHTGFANIDLDTLSITFFHADFAMTKEYIEKEEVKYDKETIMNNRGGVRRRASIRKDKYTK